MLARSDYKRLRFYCYKLTLYTMQSSSTKSLSIMTQLIYCYKLKEESEALCNSPFPGELGQKILNQISKKAWKMWLDHQTMLINEYRLSLIDPKAREFLNQEMELFLFGNGSKKPAGYMPNN